MHVLLYSGAFAPAVPPATHAMAQRSRLVGMCDNWLFVEATKRYGEEPLRTLAALRLPFSPPIWVGEARSVRVPTPEARAQVDVALAEGRLMAFVAPTGSVVGTVGTGAQS